ncbi:MAG: SRPBCC family protein [bacterium]
MSARIENSIVIEADKAAVFDLTNDIARWPELFTHEYEKAEVLKKEGNRITFRLTTFPEEDHGRMSWISWRDIDRENWRAHAERQEPLYPFKFMHIDWTYEDVPEGVKMTWVQRFEMDPACGHTDEGVAHHLNEGTRVQMKKIKEKIEEGWR